MQRIGLALSGGGFRAAIYHLGVIRFLRDAGILPKISHITSVSGGSVTAAHLALNWDRYCGSPTEFNQAAREIVRFVQLDVRNRIVRRFPLGAMLNNVGRLVRVPSQRHLTRPGMLEAHYRKHLFGEVSLFELPDRPRLHILSTNLSEGGLCSFCKDGLLLQRRSPSNHTDFEKVSFGLATVPMAVAASSAFPGFFPPLEVSGAEVGADEGELKQQAFTDGGVIDNLGLRMFRCIENSWVRDTTPLGAEDLLNRHDVFAALRATNDPQAATPLLRIRELLKFRHYSPAESLNSGDTATESTELTRLARGLWEIMGSETLYRDSAFAGLELTDASAQPLLDYARSTSTEIDWGDHLWLNRHLINAAFEQAMGKPCLEVGRQGFRKVLVSDAGAKFKVARDGRAGGIIATALRSSDIAMDRVYQLELEAVRNTAGVVFFPMADVVTRAQDRSAPHPEIQRQAARIRTDMDRFSELEITALVQHGYCVARKHCVGDISELAETIPSGPPWNPFGRDDDESRALNASPLHLDDETRALATARDLQKSSRRRIWSTLFSFRDWPTYVYVPLLVTLALSLPVSIYHLSQSRAEQQLVLEAVAQTSPLYNKLLNMLRSHPPQELPDVDFEDVETMEPVDYSGFEVLSSSMIFDVRNWSRSSDVSLIRLHARMLVRRISDAENNSMFRFQMQPTDAVLAPQCRSSEFSPVLSRLQSDGVTRWELALDLSRVPFSRSVELVTDAVVQPRWDLDRIDNRFYFRVVAETSIVRCWMLMPPRRRFTGFEVLAFQDGDEKEPKIITPDAKVELSSASLASFHLINPEPGYRYECRWQWLDEADSDVVETAPN